MVVGGVHVVDRDEDEDVFGGPVHARRRVHLRNAHTNEHPVRGVSPEAHQAHPSELASGVATSWPRYSQSHSDEFVRSLSAKHAATTVG